MPSLQMRDVTERPKQGEGAYSAPMLKIRCCFDRPFCGMSPSPQGAVAAPLRRLGGPAGCEEGGLVDASRGTWRWATGSVAITNNNHLGGISLKG